MRRVLWLVLVSMVVVTSAAGAVALGGDESRSSGRDAPVPSLVPASYPSVPREPAARPGPSNKLEWPVHGAVTGRFGELRAGHTHEGIDIPMPAGTPIRAAGSGKVVMREVQDGYGKYTCVAHRTITTCYGHQSRFHTEMGAEVGRGELIGYVGDSGNAAGFTHLHFEVRRGKQPWGTPVSPRRFLPAP